MTECAVIRCHEDATVIAVPPYYGATPLFLCARHLRHTAPSVGWHVTPVFEMPAFVNPAAAWEAKLPAEPQ